MLESLLESGRRRAPRPTCSTLASVIAHVALIGGAVGATDRSGTPRPIDVDPQEKLVFMVSRQPVSTPAQSSASVRESVWRVVRELRPIAVPMPPPVDLSQGMITMPNNPLPFGEGISSIVPSTSIPGAADAIYDERVVERAASPRNDNPRPDYPTSLRFVGVEGEVVARFVVDTTGRVERTSIVIVQATHPLFGDAVGRWLPRTRYTPAEIQGRRVRQLVQQTIGFALRP